MARDISIAYSARDQISPAVNSMRSSNRQFNKDLEETQQKIDTLNKRQDSLTEGLAKAKRRQDEMTAAYKEAKKAYAEYGEVLGKDYLDEYARNMTEAIQQTRDFENTIRSNRREIQRQSDDLNRMANRASGSEQSIMGSLAQAGMFNMVGTSAVNALNAGIGSMFGDAVGDAINTTLSGAISGATLGMMAGGAPGAIVGAGIGTAAGVIDAATGYFQKEDEAFKSVRNDLVQSQMSDLAALDGIPLASTREGNLRRFEALGAQDADQFNQEMIEIGRTPPFSYDTAVGLSSSMLGLGIEEDVILGRINNLADAAAALNLTESDVNTIVTQLETAQMLGKVDSRAMRSLVRMGINPYEALAETLTVDGKNITPDEVAEYLPDLEVDMFVDAMYKYMGMRFEGAAAGMADTYAGISGIVESYQEDAAAAQAQSYMDARVPALQVQADYLAGESGAKMMDAERLFGEWQASLDNERERLEREHMDAALKRIEEEGLLGAEAGEAIAEAKINAQIEYAETEGAKKMVELETGLIASTTNALRQNPAMYDAAFELGQAYSKGMLAGLLDGLSGGGIGQIVSKGSSVISAAASGRLMGGDDTFAPSAALQLWDRRYGANDSPAPGNAWGLPYVPYDNYLTRLHEGERVLTASEVRAADHGPPTITINMPDAVIREEADIDKIARAIAANIIQAQRITTTGG